MQKQLRELAHNNAFQWFTEWFKQTAIYHHFEIHKQKSDSVKSYNLLFYTVDGVVLSRGPTEEWNKKNTAKRPALSYL